MNPEAFLTTAWPSLVDWTRQSYLWCRKHFRRVLFALGAASVAYTALFMYQARFQEEVVVLTAARGTSSWRSAARIVEKLREVERVPGVKYSVRSEMTNGAEEINERVRGD